MARTKAIAVGIVGLGRAGWGMHCGALRQRPGKFRIVAGCDPVKARRDMLAEAHGATPYRTFEQLLADRSVELIDIASPTTYHVPQALAALAADKDVFLEKPIGVSFAETSQLQAAVKASKGRLFIRHNRRFEAQFIQVQQIIASGILGDVFEIKLRRHGYSRRDDWQTLMHKGGGQLLNWGPHVIDHALQFLDGKVESIWSDLKRVAAVGDAEDHLKIVLRGESGCVVDLEISGGTAISEPVYTVHGSRGALISGGKGFRLRYLDPKQKLARRKARAKTPEHGSFGSKESLPWIEKEVKCRRRPGPEVIWDALHASIRKGEEYPITLEQALAVMKVISTARRNTPFAATEG